MTLEDALRYGMMGGGFQGPEKRLERISDRELVDQVFARIDELAVNEDGVAEYDARILKTLLQNALRRGVQLDEADFQRQIDKFDSITKSGALPQYAKDDARFIRMNRLQELGDFFTDINELATDSEVTVEDKARVFKLLQDATVKYADLFRDNEEQK